MAQDFTKLPAQIITDLINTDNPGSNLNLSVLSYGVPSVAPGDSPAKNTVLVATAVPGSGYSGTRTLYYDRVDFSTIPGTRSTEFELNGSTNISDLIPAINAAYQLNIQPEDYIDGALPTFDSGDTSTTKPFTLTAATDSLVFISAVTLSIKRDSIPLEDGIVNNVLDGLTWGAIPLEDGMSSRVLNIFSL